MSFRSFAFAAVLSLALGSPAFAGLTWTAETFAPLPARWNGFLTEHRLLRLVAVASPADANGNPLRDRYLQAVTRLLEARAVAPLSAARIADLGGLYVRLGDYPRAIATLKTGFEAFPNDSRICGNLAVAWHLSGDLERAESLQEQVVRLSLPTERPGEELYRRLLRLRRAEARGESSPDRLFDIDWTRPIPAEVLQKLPPDSVAMVQRLALWLPADGRLLLLLGEMAAAFGDVRTAAAIVDGCASEFGMGGKVLRQRRQDLRRAADAISALPDKEHAKYRGTIAFASSRPLSRTIDASELPPIRDDGTNVLPWSIVAETVVDKPFRPKFHDYLQKLDGRKVSLAGFVHPLGEDAEANGFLLLEYPVGCWFCEIPEPTALVRVRLPEGQSMVLPRGLMQVEGTLKLNLRDAEEFLYTLDGAKIRRPE